MADRRAKYKQKGRNFGDVEQSRLTRLEKQDQRRKEIRSQNFSRLRHITESSKPQSPEKPVTSRTEKLASWKKQKELKKKTEKKVVKPPFKVGIVHHRAFSPPFINSNLPSCSHWNVQSQNKIKSEPSTPNVKKITRVTEKRLAAKAAAKAAAAALTKKSFAPPNHKFKPPEGLPNIPLFGRIKKGSIDTSEFTWNLSDKKTLRKSGIKTPRASQRKSSISSSREESRALSLSSRGSKKFKSDSNEQEVTTAPKALKTRASYSFRKRPSESSSDSLLLQVTSEDTEVFTSPIPELSTSNEGKKTMDETITIFSQSLERNQISSIKVNEESIKSTSTEGDSIKLQVTDLSEEHFSKITDLDDDSFKTADQADSRDVSLKTDRDSFRTDLCKKAQDSSKADQDSCEADQDSCKIGQEVSLKATNEEEDSSEADQADTGLPNNSEKSFNESLNLALFSPYVVTRRGKKEARKEQKIRRGFNHSPEEIPTKETVMQNLNVSIEEEKRTAQYFKCLLEGETNRLSERCDLWSDIIEKENPPEEAKEIIEQAIGQTRLLMRSKFKQFAGLVAQCEDGSGDCLISCKDLQGFWDMMNVTVKNCEDRFQKVEELKARDWKEEETQTLKIKKAPTRKRLPSKKSPLKNSPNKKPSAKSSLRAMIMAERQRLKQLKDISDAKVDECPEVTISDRRLSIAPQDMKRVSFSVSEKFTVRRASLRSQEEIDNEKGMEVETGNVHVHLDESIIYINSEQTPGKSILKRIKVENKLDDSRVLRSTQKVNFNDKVELNEIETKEKMESLFNFTTDRVNSTDFEEECVPEVHIRAEKKLNFEDMSFNEAANAPEEDDSVFAETPSKVLQTPKLTTNSESSSAKKNKENKSKSPRSVKKTKMNLDLSISQKEIKEEDNLETTWKSPRLAKKNKINLDLDNSISVEGQDEENKDEENKDEEKKDEENKDEEMKKYIWKSPRLAKNNMTSDFEISSSEKIKKLTPILKKNKKINFDSGNSSVERVQVDEDDEEIKERKLTWKSPRSVKTNKVDASSTEKIMKNKKLTPKSPKLSRSKKINLDLENSFPVEESPVEENEEIKNTWKSPRLAKNNKLTSNIENPSVEKLKEKALTPKSPKLTKQNTINLDLESLNLMEDDDDNTFSRSLRNRTVTGNLTPKSAKKMNNSSTDVKQFDSPSSTKSLRKMRKSPKRKSGGKENENEEYKKKVRLHDSTPDKSLMSETKSPRSGKSNLRSADKLFSVELMGEENASSNLETESLVDSKKKINTKNILTEKSKNLKDFLNASLKDLRISKPKTPRRSMRIPENELLGEKENETPGIFKREHPLQEKENKNVFNSPKDSPKPIETPSKRKSIKRSMSCHVAECQMEFLSTSQLQRSNSSKLKKSLNSRRSLNPASFTST